MLVSRKVRNGANGKSANIGPGLTELEQAQQWLQVSAAAERHLLPKFALEVARNR
jgi:hypothetical protein